LSYIREPVVRFPYRCQPMNRIAFSVEGVVRAAVDEHQGGQTPISRNPIEIPGPICKRRVSPRGMPTQNDAPSSRAGREDHTVQFGDLHGEPPTASERCGPVRLCAIAALQVVVELLIAAEVAPIDQVLLPPVQGPHLCVRHRGAEISPYTAKDSSR